MKKKLIAMAAVAMFSVGLAFYANSSNLNVINETNVEALADGEGFDLNETADYIKYPQINKLFVKHGKNKTFLGFTLNTCENDGCGCLIDLGSQDSGDVSTNKKFAEDVKSWAFSVAKDLVKAWILKKGF